MITPFVFSLGENFFEKILKFVNRILILLNQFKIIDV